MVRPLLRLVFLVVLVLVLLVAWVGVRGWLAKDHLQNSADLVQRLQVQLERGDTVPARTTLRELQSETGSAVRLTGDRVWGAFGHLPGIGDDMQAVHAVAVSGHTLTTDALPSLTTAASDIHTLRNTGGDLTPKELAAAAQRLKAPLTDAKAGVDRARQEIRAVDAAGLIAPVRSGVVEFSAGLDRLSAELASLLAADSTALKAAGALGVAGG